MVRPHRAVFSSGHSGSAIRHGKHCGDPDNPAPPIAHPCADQTCGGACPPPRAGSDQGSPAGVRRKAGLYIRRGDAIDQVCRTRTLVPLVAWGGIRTPAKPLSTAAAEFDRAARTAVVGVSRLS
jgi:hypothetical protein